MQIENQIDNQIEARILYKNCPLCESNNISKSIVGDCSKQFLYNSIIPPTMQWMDCADCKHQFIDGYWNNEALDVIFSKTRENQIVGYQVEQQRIISAKIIEKVIPFKSYGTWLDVGFGNGNLLFTAEEYGYEPIGVDLRKDGVITLQKLFGQQEKTKEIAIFAYWLSSLDSSCRRLKHTLA